MTDGGINLRPHLESSRISRGGGRDINVKNQADFRGVWPADIPGDLCPDRDLQSISPLSAFVETDDFSRDSRSCRLLDRGVSSRDRADYRQGHRLPGRGHPWGECYGQIYRYRSRAGIRYQY